MLYNVGTANIVSTLPKLSPNVRNDQDIPVSKYLVSLGRGWPVCAVNNDARADIRSIVFSDCICYRLSISMQLLVTNAIFALRAMIIEGFLFDLIGVARTAQWIGS